MSRKYKISDQAELYFISITVINWIDLFVRKEYMNILLDSWKFCQEKKGLLIFGWCIMTSHFHMIIGSTGQTVEKTIGQLKSYTSHRLREAITGNKHESREWIPRRMITRGLKNSNNRDWQLWQQGSHPIAIFSPHVFYQKLDYIHNNPVLAGFVDRPEDWVYSSARDFCNRKGLVELSYIV